MIKKTFRMLMLQRKFPLAVMDLFSSIDNASYLGEHAVLFKNARVVCSRIGRYTYLQENAFILNADIGPFTSIGSNVTIGLINHPINMVCTSPVFYDCSQPLPRFFTDSVGGDSALKKTIVEADVWIGDGVKIIEGIRVGVGSVVGAGSVVTKDIPPYTIAAGNPCRIIRGRFNESISSELLASKWWEMSDEKLLELSPFFNDPELFLGELGK
ncbi:antibiotic acetyltransferase [Polynucleobacter paneuropaeus]|nr:antibiotic acetyltransferase [Polynucleobacter paneuropaeus]